MLALGERQRVDDMLPRPGRTAEPFQLHIDEADIEGGVVKHELRTRDEVEELRGETGEDRFVGEELRRKPMHGEGLRGHVALGVDIFVPGPTGRDVVGEFDAGDLHQPVAIAAVEPGGFGIHHDFAQIRSLSTAPTFTQTPGASAPWPCPADR